jgi:hypothetical protein
MLCLTPKNQLKALRSPGPRRGLPIVEPLR